MIHRLIKYLLITVATDIYYTLNAQTISIVIGEDNTNPDKPLYYNTSEYKSGASGTDYISLKQANFPTGLILVSDITPIIIHWKKKCKEAIDMYFTKVNLKGSKDSFISVDANYLYIMLTYNGLG